MFSTWHQHEGVELQKGNLVTSTPLELLHGYIFSLAEKLPGLVADPAKEDELLQWCRGVISFPVCFVRENAFELRYAASMNARQKLQGTAKVTTPTARQQVHNICHLWRNV